MAGHALAMLPLTRFWRWNEVTCYIATASTKMPYFMYSYTCFAGIPESLLCLAK
jgi:hypothetical protein